MFNPDVWLIHTEQVRGNKRRLRKMSNLNLVSSCHILKVLSGFTVFITAILELVNGDTLTECRRKCFGIWGTFVWFHRDRTKWKTGWIITAHSGNVRRHHRHHIWTGNKFPSSSRDDQQESWPAASCVGGSVSFHVHSRACERQVNTTLTFLHH